MLLLSLKLDHSTKIFYFDRAPEIILLYSFRRGCFYLSEDGQCLQVNLDGKPILNQVEGRNQLVKSLVNGELIKYISSGKNEITHILELEIIREINNG